MKILELFLLFSTCECERWLLLGGYTGFEGEDATAVRNEVELIELTDSDKFSKKTSWCQNAHNSVIYDRVLVCGGSDNDYGITNKCR